MWEWFVRPTLFLQFHQPRDQLLADRGFTMVEEFVTGCVAELLIPSFTKGKKQLSPKEIEVYRKISSVRIHTRRVIGLLKKHLLFFRAHWQLI